MKIIKKILLVLLVFTSFSGLFAETLKKDSKRQKILIFTSSIGGGHKSPTEAATLALQNQYEIEIANFSEQITTFIEPISKLTKGHYNSEQFFSFIAKNGWNELANQISELSLQQLDSKQLEKKIEDRLVVYLKKKKPDLVISVIGFVNYPIARATDRLNIPFIIIPTDLDQSIAMHGFQKYIGESPERFPLLRYAISSVNFEINKTIKPFSLSKDQIVPIGFPLRPQFFDKKNIAELKKEWKIPTDKQVVMLLLGGLGGNNTYDWARLISHFKPSVYLIACVGSNQELAKKIKAIPKPQKDFIRVVEYTPNISDLMSMADVLVVKPGTNSVMEALALGKPVVLDITNGSPLKIEQFNCLFLSQYNLGYLAKKRGDLVGILNQINRHKIMSSKVSLKNSANFSRNLSFLVKSLLQESKKSSLSKPIAK